MMDAVDLSGRTCLVTGASGGVGKEVARGLVRLGATVIIACRDPQRGEAARRELATEAPAGPQRVELMLVDLSRQASIRPFAAAVLTRHRRLHVLVNNAAIYARVREVTRDGFEATWATNVLAYHLLTALLLLRLHDCAPARIVNVASSHAGGLDPTDLGFERRRFFGGAAYRQSKQANRMLSWELDRRLVGSGVTVNVADPGWVTSDITRRQRGLWGLAIRSAFRVWGRPPADGADTPLWLAASPELAGIGGRFWRQRRAVACAFRDPRAEAALWRLCDAQTGLAAAAAAR